MIELEPYVSDKLKESVQDFLKYDHNAKQISDVEEQLRDKRLEVAQLEANLDVLQKTRPEITLEYRKLIMWCLEVDADNRYYFLKSKEGLVKCTEYKHKTKLSAKQNNAFGATLSAMFKEGLVGRIEHFDMYFYGLASFFEKDNDGLLTELKTKHVKNIPYLRKITK